MDDSILSMLLFGMRHVVVHFFNEKKTAVCVLFLMDNAESGQTAAKLEQN